MNKNKASVFKNLDPKKAISKRKKYQILDTSMEKITQNKEKDDEKMQEKLTARKIKAVIFDLDGTLLDTLLDIQQALNMALEELNYAPLSIDEVRMRIGRGFLVLAEKAFSLAQTRGRIGTKQACEELTLTNIPNSPMSPVRLNKAGSEQSELDILHDKLCDYYKETYLATSKPYAGIFKLLEKLQSKDVKIAIHTNKNEDYVKNLLEKCLPTIKFAFVKAQSKNSRKKPDPQDALWCAKEWNYPPQEIFYVGDSDVDIKTALAGGFIPIHVAWGFRSYTEVREALKTTTFANENFTSVSDVAGLEKILLENIA